MELPTSIAKFLRKEAVGMLRNYSTAQAAEKLGLDISELQFLLLHFREFVSKRTSVDTPLTLTDEDLLLLGKAYHRICAENIDPSAIRSALRMERQGVRLSGRCHGGVLAFSGGRNGAGKSSVIWNLANLLASRGYRTTIFDGSKGSAGVGWLLVSGGRIPEDTYDWNIRFHSGVTLVWGERFRGAGLPLEDLTIIDEATDILLVDTGEGQWANALQFARVADEIIEVTTADVSNNADCLSAIQMLKGVNPDAAISIIINKARTFENAREAFSRLNGAALRGGLPDLTSLGWVAEDDAMARYMAEGIPVVEALPTSVTAKCIGRIADAVAQRPTSMMYPTGGGVQAVMEAMLASRNRAVVEEFAGDGH